MKVKKFFGRSIKDILPVNKALAYKQIPVDSTCIVCGMLPETTSRMLLNCDRASG